ncbi:hypothetical protein [Saccharopolyspora hattusasensis]|uniref:hypothetical protein n=1 Tax=Saccharopolyspora hattusasensis TaxID=1128679 RepID=UPI003D954452
MIDKSLGSRMQQNSPNWTGISGNRPMVDVSCGGTRPWRSSPSMRACTTVPG